MEKPSLKAEKKADGWHLSLSGKPYTLFQLPIAVPLFESNVLKPLRLYSLDISYSSVSDVERLHGLTTLEELNIAGIKKIPRHKWYVFQRIRLKRVYHTLEQSDDFIARNAGDVEFIRIAD